MVSINFLFCRSLRPAAWIVSGEMRATLSLAPNDENRVVNLTQSFMLSDSMMFTWECSVGNPFKSACKIAGGLRKIASEVCATSQGSVGW